MPTIDNKECNCPCYWCSELNTPRHRYCNWNCNFPTPEKKDETDHKMDLVEENAKKWFEQQTSTPEKKCKCIACKNGMKTGHTVFNQFIKNQKSMNHQPIFTPSWEERFDELYSRIEGRGIPAIVSKNGVHLSLDNIKVFISQLLKEEREKAYQLGRKDGYAAGVSLTKHRTIKAIKALEDGKNNIK